MRGNSGLVALCALTVLCGTAVAKKNPVIGGAEMLPDKDVVENLEKSSDHTEFVKRIKAAHLVDTLKGTGPYTVFAPMNAAFINAASSNQEELVRLLTHQVVPGNYTSKTLRKMVKSGNGTVSLKTMAGDKIAVTTQGGKLMLDGVAITRADVKQKNGTLHVVPSVFFSARSPR